MTQPLTGEAAAADAAARRTAARHAAVAQGAGRSRPRRRRRHRRRADLCAPDPRWRRGRPRNSTPPTTARPPTASPACRATIPASPARAAAAGRSRPADPRRAEPRPARPVAGMAAPTSGRQPRGAAPAAGDRGGADRPAVRLDRDAAARVTGCRRSASTPTARHCAGPDQPRPRRRSRRRRRPRIASSPSSMRRADRRTVAPDRVAAPASPYVLQAGAVIPAALITGIRSDLPGQITAQVTENVYDSPTGRILLIPQGTRLIGQYDNGVGFGQRRVLLVWNRLIFPNGRSIVLERQPGADAEGYAGLEDGVDYHWWRSRPRPPASRRCSASAPNSAVRRRERLLRAIRDGAPGHHQRRRPADRPPPAQHRADADHPAGLSRSASSSPATSCSNPTEADP